MTLLLVAVKSLLVLTAALLLIRHPRFTAAQRHLVLMLAMAGLPLMFVMGVLGGSDSWPPWVGPAAGYAWVSAMLLAYWLVQLIRTSRWIRRNTAPDGWCPSLPGASRRVGLRRSRTTVSPLTWGVLKPVVVVPGEWSRWSTVRKRAVLAHEMAHVRRWDTLTSTMSVLVSCLFWINPLVWVVHRRLLAEAEQACDDAVVSQGISPTVYAGELLALARARTLPLAHEAAAQSTLSRRIRALANPGTRRKIMNTRQVLGTMVLTAALVVPIAAIDARASADVRRDPMPGVNDGHQAALHRAQALIDAEDFDQALEVVEPLLAKDSNANEAAQTHNMLGYIHFSKDDPGRALDHYLQVLSFGDEIPAGLRLKTHFTAAQLSFILERYTEAIEHIRSWQELADDGSTAVAPHIFTGQVYYKLNEYQRAIQEINTGIALAEIAGTPIKENWWALLVYLYYEEGQFQECIDVLERLRHQYPDEKYDRRLEHLEAMVG